MGYIGISFYKMSDFILVKRQHTLTAGYSILPIFGPVYIIPYCFYSNIRIQCNI